MAVTGSLSTRVSPVPKGAWLLAQSQRSVNSRSDRTIDQGIQPAKELNLPRRTMLLVKNTFIECEMGEEDIRPPLRRTSSCPAFNAPPPSESAKMLKSSHDQTAVFESEASSAEEAGSTAATDTPELGSDPEDVAEHAADGKTMRLSEGAVPSGQWRPGMSVGSQLHELKQCRPCAWYWRPQGCVNGADCRHCHLCSPDALKARRKMKEYIIHEMGMKQRCRTRRPPTRGSAGHLAAKQKQAAAAPARGR